MLTKEEFHKVFIGGFKAGHALTGFKSLDIKPDREAKAEACSHAIHESIVDIPSLHFMLTPNSKWWGRAFSIGTFMVPTVIGISIEIKARKQMAAQPVQPANSAETATTQPQAEGSPTPEQAAILAGAG
jgi:hypothetical protein